ncbi:hypothetical protein HOC50_07330 [archaeon]|nr:hypothetical protein [archaeon]MBT5422980.1 hypothetical protein [archaeon]MBT6773170.1 hypothetical protein [archaeon]
MKPGKVKKKKKLQKTKAAVNYFIIFALLLLLIISLIKYLVGIILAIVFAIITFFIVKIDVRLEYIALNCFFASSCFFGFLFGPVIGFIYAFLVGFISFGVHKMSLNAIVTITISTAFGVFSGLMQPYLGWSWSLLFLALTISFAIVSGFTYYILNGNLPRVLGIQTSQFFLNLFIYSPLFNLIIKLVTPLLI